MNIFRKLFQPNNDPQLRYDEAVLRFDAAVEKVIKLRAIADAAWEVRREESDYNPVPDLGQRARARKQLNKLLDGWKATAEEINR